MRSNLSTSLFQSLKNMANKPTTPTLKPGQIITGKVMQLYPDQRALVKYGSHQLVAQLEAALSKGQKYWFQVQSTDQTIYLKVLSNQPSIKDSNNSLNQLFKIIGENETNKRRAFVDSVIKDKIPVQKETLKQALQLIDQTKGSNDSKQTVLAMLKRQLPMTQSIFSALMARHNSRLSETIRNAELLIDKQGESTATQKQLSTFLSSFKNVTQPFNQIFNEQLENNNRSIYRLMQKMELVPKSINENSFKAKTIEWDQGRGSQTPYNSNVTHAERKQTLTTNSYPFNIEEDNIKQRLTELWRQQLPVSEKQQKLVTLFNDGLIKLQSDTNQSHSNQPEKLMRFLMTNKEIIIKLSESGTFGKILPLLSNNEKLTLNNLVSFVKSNVNGALETARINEITQLSTKISSIMQQQINKEDFQSFSKLLLAVNEQNNNTAIQPKDQFLIKLKSYMQTMGFQDEHNFIQKAMNGDKSDVQQTLKQILVQTINESPELKTSETLKQLIQQINGMQLSFIDDQQRGTIQLNLQLPGSYFGFKNDFFLDIEGKQSEDGEIHPDHCHILFYLDLENLNETVIDMNVQKRIVHLTVFTENDQAGPLIMMMQEQLKKGLESLDYKLSRIQFKPLRTNEDEKDELKLNPKAAEDEGVDFRV